MPPRVSSTIAPAAPQVHVYPAFVTQGLWDELTRRGVSARELERMSGVARPRRGDFLSTLPQPELLRLLEAAVELTGDDGLGLSLGRAVGGAGLHLLGHLLLASTSLRQALEIASRSGPHWCTPAIEELPGNSARFGFYSRKPPTLGLRVKHQAIAVILHDVALHFLDETSEAPRAELDFPMPSDTGPYRRAFPGGVRFDAEGTFICLPRTALDRRRAGADPELVQQLLTLAQDRYGAVQPNSDWTSRVRRALRTYAAPRLVDPDVMARQFGVSRRALWRRLAREGTSFSTLADEILYERARVLLARPRTTCKQVAETLGYAELSSFYRAFRRWSGGLTLTEYRRHQRGQP